MPLCPVPSDRTRIACVGDSITSGAKASTPESTYPGVLQSMLGDATHSVENLGVCGSTVIKNPWPLSPPFINPYPPLPWWEQSAFRRLVERAPWDVVVIAFGGNDVAFTNLDGSSATGCRADVSGCSFFTDLAELVRLARTLGRSIDEPPKILVSVHPRLMGFPFPWPSTYPFKQPMRYPINLTKWNVARKRIASVLHEWATTTSAVGDHPRRIKTSTPFVDGIVDFHDDDEPSDWWNASDTSPVLPVCKWVKGAPKTNARDRQRGEESHSAESASAWSWRWSLPTCEFLCDAQSCDTVHPNDQGNRMMAKTVLRELRVVGAAPSAHAVRSPGRTVVSTVT